MQSSFHFTHETEAWKENIVFSKYQNYFVMELKLEPRFPEFSISDCSPQHVKDESPFMIFYLMVLILPQSYWMNSNIWRTPTCSLLYIHLWGGNSFLAIPIKSPRLDPVLEILLQTKDSDIYRKKNHKGVSEIVNIYRGFNSFRCLL